MKTSSILFFTLILALASIAVQANSYRIYRHYGYNFKYKAKYCESKHFYCVKVKPGQTWQSLFPDPEKRDLVMRINRLNTRLVGGMYLRVPRNSELDVSDFAPFDHNVNTNGQRQIIIDPKLMAWAAYNEQGDLIKWGPASLGKDYCADSNEACRTVTGKFAIYRKKGPMCKSNKYPLPNGGSPMPYCMHFYGGYAIHGSEIVPGTHESHGCVRMFTEDAKWLNQQFAQIGTHVIVRSY